MTLGELRFTLVSDGRSDQALVRVLRWALIENGVNRAIAGSWADLGRLRTPPRRLQEKIGAALHFYPCELLFIHRDAERRSLGERQAEIHRVLRRVCTTGGQVPPALCVVPVRMTEAWFLFDEAALRQAAGNPNGRAPLALPRTNRIESIANPKDLLHTLIIAASGLEGRRRSRLRPEAAVHRLADLIVDYRPLRDLPAFAALDDEVRRVVRANAWDIPD